MARPPWPKAADSSLPWKYREHSSTTPAPRGWVCPACGKGNAPWSAVCGHCRRADAAGRPDWGSQLVPRVVPNDWIDPSEEKDG